MPIRPGWEDVAEISAQALLSPVLEAVLPRFERLSSGRNTTVRSDPHDHADQVTNLNGDHRRRCDQRGGERALFMRELNENGEDYGQKSRWDENANFKAESKNRADEERNNKCHFLITQIIMPPHLV